MALLFRVMLLLGVLEKCELLEPENHARCNPNEVFCLFTFDEKMWVKTITDAVHLCRNAKVESWPVYTLDMRRLVILHDYMLGVPHLKNEAVLLHARIRVDSQQWEWILSPETTMPVDENVFVRVEKTSTGMFYRINTGRRLPKAYRLVCIHVCDSKIIRTQNHGFLSGRVLPRYTQRMCLLACETSPDCKAWGWANGVDACRLFNNTENEDPESLAEVKVLDRSTKTPENCIRSIAKVFPPTTSRPDDSDSSAQILWPFIIFCLSGLSVGIFALIKYKKFGMTFRSKSSMLPSQGTVASIIPITKDT